MRRSKINARRGFRRVAGLVCALLGVAVLALGQASNEPPTGGADHGRLDHPPGGAGVRLRVPRRGGSHEADLLVIELSTPGGLLTSTREIVQEMLGAETPVAVYVSPSGAHAASAGFFLLMAADVAAMAPGTNTGAAHPVGGQGEDVEGDLGEKVEQDAAAQIRSLASRNGRDADLAESAVVESKSFTAEEALENGLIDLIAADMQRAAGGDRRPDSRGRPRRADHPAHRRAPRSAVSRCRRSSACCRPSPTPTSPTS